MTQEIIAQHRKSGRTGHISDTMEDNRGALMYWFEQDFYRDGTASGWKYLNELNAPSLNGREIHTGQHLQGCISCYNFTEENK